MQFNFYIISLMSQGIDWAIKNNLPEAKSRRFTYCTSLKYSKSSEFVYLPHLANACHKFQLKYCYQLKTKWFTFQIEIRRMNKNSILLLSFASNLTWLAFNGLCKSLKKYFQFFKSLSSILQMVKSQNTIDANAIWPYWCRPDCAANSISGPANSDFLVVALSA